MGKPTPDNIGIETISPVRYLESSEAKYVVNECEKCVWSE
jgi:hypothetical protein